MYKNSIEADELKSDDFKKLKKEKEELFPATFNSDAVKGVQSFLNEEGYKDKKGEKLRVNGRYEADTANAAMDYQRENGLSVDGIVGDETWDSIYNKKKKKEERIKSSAENWLGKNSEKIPDVWNIPEIKNSPRAKGSERKNRIKPWGPYVPGTDWDIWGKYVPEGEKTPLNKKGINKRGLDTPGERRNIELYSYAPGETEKSGENKDMAFAFTGNEPAGEYLSNTKLKEETEPEAKEESGVINPGYNAKGEWSEDPDADNYGEDSAKYKLLTVFDRAWSIADTTNKRNLSAISINLRDFDASTIDRAYYLNSEFGAGWQGHAAILLVNQLGKGILFSYGAATGDFFDGPARMNIGIYSPIAVENLLNKKEVFVVSNTGNMKREKYGRNTDYTISVEDGYKMFDKAVEVTKDMNEYNVLTNNCDQITTEIFKAGGINIFSLIRPNWTYDLESSIDFIRDLVKGE